MKISTFISTSNGSCCLPILQKLIPFRIIFIHLWLPLPLSNCGVHRSLFVWVCSELYFSSCSFLVSLVSVLLLLIGSQVFTSKISDQSIFSVVSKKFKNSVTRIYNQRESKREAPLSGSQLISTDIMQKLFNSSGNDSKNECKTLPCILFDFQTRMQHLKYSNSLYHPSQLASS